jgi:cell division protein FtsW
MEQRKIPSLKLDYIMVLALGGLLIIGLVMVTSSSMVVAQHSYGNSFYFIIRQGIFAVIGLSFILLMLTIPTQYWQNIGATWLITGLILLILVLIPGIGHVVNGSRRWIIFGPIAIQVSELVKLCAVMYVSGYLCRHAQEVKNSLKGIIKPVFALGMMGTLLLMEPDFGATVVMFMTALGMMFMAGARLRWFYLLIILAILSAGLLIVFSPYRMARFLGFLNPWSDQLGTGYQLSQSLIAFGRGGIFGVGLGNSVQKLFYLPEAYTDFVMAIIAEELGALGILLVLGLFGILVWRGMMIGKRAHVQYEWFDAYCAYGLTFWLALQVVVNAGVNMGLLPTKGLTLPFISYGGSSLVVDCMAVGILMRIDLQNQLRSYNTVIEKMAKRTIKID